MWAARRRRQFQRTRLCDHRPSHSIMPSTSFRLLATASALILLILGPTSVSSFLTSPNLVPSNRCASTIAASSTSEQETDLFFVRDADFADLGPAARILTDGFFSDANFITYQIERLNNFLSFESTFPRPGTTDSVMHSMVVACRQTDGKVLGFVELDGRPTDDPKAPPRPYMCNLAVDKKWKRKGIAKSLVKLCEERAILWGKDQMSLKVRETNKAATCMYQSLGYSVKAINIESPVKGQPPDTIILMTKQLSCGKTEDKESQPTSEHSSLAQ